MLGSAYSFGLRDHMSMSFFVEKFDENVQRILSMVSEMIIILFSASVLLYGGVNITLLTMGQVSAALGIPMGYVYLILPLSGLLIIFYSVNNLLAISKQKDTVKSNS